MMLKFLNTLRPEYSVKGEEEPSKHQSNNLIALISIIQLRNISLVPEK